MQDLIKESAVVGLLASILMQGEEVVEETGEEIEGVMEVMIGYVAAQYVANKIKDNEPPSFAKQQKIAEKIEGKLSEVLKPFAVKINDRLHKYLYDVAEKALKKGSKLLKTSKKEVNFNDFDKKTMQKLIKELNNSYISGISIDDYLASYTATMHSQIKSEIMQGVAKGESIEEIAARLDKRKKISKNTLARQVRTESVTQFNQAQLMVIKQSNITKVRYTAVLDGKTTPICRSFDGNIMDVEGLVIGKNAPPMHYNCRSTLIPVA